MLLCDYVVKGFRNSETTGNFGILFCLQQFVHAFIGIIQNMNEVNAMWILRTTQIRNSCL
jgi:hypothetical protein